MTKFKAGDLSYQVFSYNIRCRPGKDDVVSDALRRSFCNATSVLTIIEVHNNLCHLGVTWMLHYVRTKNLPSPILKPRSERFVCILSYLCWSKSLLRFFLSTALIMSTKPMARLSIDFKEPLPSRSNNHYLFVAVDEYSRYPNKNISAATDIQCLTSVFSLWSPKLYTFGPRYQFSVSKTCNSFFSSKESLLAILAPTTRSVKAR